MNSKYSILAVLLAVLTLMTSCLGDSEEGTTYNDAAITAFSLGTLKRIVHTKTKYTKVDSTYETTVACSAYTFSIDQANGLIYNLDSLPVGTCVDKALVTISTANSSAVGLKSFTSDTLYYYSSSSDSLDFSQPRVVRVFATDGSNVKSYTVDVRVHKEKDDSLYWNQKMSSIQIAGLDGMRSIIFDNSLVAYGIVDGQAKAYYTSIDDGNTWRTLALPSSSAVTMAANGTNLYALANGTVYSTAGVTADFTEIASNTNLKTLITASRSEVYAISLDNKIMVSKDNGASWTEDATNDDLANLPANDINGFSYTTKTNSDIDKVIMIGNRAVVKDSCCVVWSKVVDNGYPSATQRWIYQPFYSSQWHNGPALHKLSVAPYNDGILMIGGEGLGTCLEPAFSTLFFSRDDGLNWWKDKRFFLPQGFSSSETSFSMATDKNNCIWLLCGKTGQVWKGYLSQLTWK